MCFLFLLKYSKAVESVFYLVRSNRVLCNIIAGLVLLGIVIPLTWMVSDRDPPSILISGVTIPAAVAVGQDYRLKWQYKPTYKVCDGEVTWILVDSEKTRWTTPPAPP